MARIPGLDQVTKQEAALKNIAGHLQDIANSANTYRETVGKTNEEYQDLASTLDEQVKKLQGLKAAGKVIAQEDIDLANKYTKQMEEMAKKVDKLVGPVGLLKKGFDELGKGLLKIFSGGITKGIDLLVEGIQRVYDLEERWTKLTGELNMKMGALSPNMGAFRKQAMQAEGTMRGLTDSMGEGTKTFEDFATAYGKMDTGKSGNFALELSRGFNLGGAAAGKFSRTLENLGITQDATVGKKGQHEQSEYFKTLTVDADKAGVPLNDLAKDFADNAGAVAKFGKAGAKAFISSAAYLKKFNVSIKDTMAFMDKFDTFDSAADSVAKLNVVFGTSINALNTMLETNPAKRFDSIRQSLLAQGKTWEKMTYFEKKALQQATGWSDEVAPALLDAKTAAESYESVMGKRAKTELAAKDADKLMHKQLQATATTMFAFGQAADKITRAIGKAIKPFTDLLGLTKSNDKEWKSFSKRMEQITNNIVEFFEALAKNDDFQEFMQGAAKAVKEAAKWVADFFSPDKLGKNIQKIIDSVKLFAEVSAGIIAGWALFKLGSGAMGAFKLIKDMAQLQGAAGAASSAKAGIGNAISGGPGLAPGAGGAGGGFGAAAGKMALGGAAGAAAGGFIGSKFNATAGGAIGGGLGGGIGALAGPIGAALGTAIGTAAGIYIEKAIDTTGLGDATGRLKDAQDKLALSSLELDIQQQKAAMQRDHRDKIDKNIENIVVKGKKKGLTLSDEERASLADRLVEMKGLGVNIQSSDAALAALADPSSGPIKLSSKQITALTTASNEYHATLKDLDEKSKTLLATIGNEQAIKLSKQGLELDKSELESKIKLTEMEIASEKKKEKTSDWVTGGSEKRRSLENKLRELQTDRVDIETRGTKLEDQIIKQKRALYELENLKEFHSVEYKKALEESGGDAAKMLEKVASMGVAISQDTVNYVKGQSRGSKAIGAPPAAPTFEPDVVERKGSKGGDTNLTVYVDNEKAHHRLIKRATKNQ